MFDDLERRSLCTLIRLLRLFMLKKGALKKKKKLETAPLTILLNFSEIIFIKGTVPKFFC